MARIARRRAPARSGVQGGLGCPHKRRDVAGALLRATAKRRGGETAMASLLVGHDASSIDPSSRPALTTSPPRHGRCRSWVRALAGVRGAAYTAKTMEEPKFLVGQLLLAMPG